jgi:hypothetical protein
MTIKESRQKMMEMFPGRTVMVSVTATFFDLADADNKMDTACRLSIVPGIKSSTCDAWTAPTMELALAKAESALRELDEDEPDYECEVE